MESQCKKGPETIMERVHWLIHDACFAISNGNMPGARDILTTADQLTHEGVAQERRSTDDPLHKSEIEQAIVSNMDEMCTQSLDPETFEKWKDVEKMIKLNRQAFK